MKKILSLGLAFLALTFLPQVTLAQASPSKEEVKKENKKVEKEAKEIKEKKELKTLAQPQAAPKKEVKEIKAEKEKADKVEIDKTKPRPYVSEEIKQPVKKKKPKTQHAVGKAKSKDN